MNVRIVPAGWPNREDLYTSHVPVLVDESSVRIYTPDALIILPRPTVAEILLDEESGE